MNAILVDMRANVLHKMQRVEQHELEERDFEEQLRCAEDDAERARLCRRWSNAYEPIQRKARTR
jgi:hypothetical protein